MNHFQVFALIVKQHGYVHSFTPYISSEWGIMNFQYWIFRLTLEEVFGYHSVSIRCALLTNNCTSNTLYSVMSFLKFIQISKLRTTASFVI